MMKFNLFGRLSLEKKRDIVTGMTTSEIMSIPDEVYIRILKEVGSGKKGARSRELYLPSQPGNHWNSVVDSLGKGTKNNLYLRVYHQLDHTDTIQIVPLSVFKSGDEWKGTAKEIYRDGSMEVHVCRYSTRQRAEVLREVLYTYLNHKNDDKLRKV